MQGYTKGIPIDVDGTLSANSDFLVASQKAVKTYVDAQVGGGGGGNYNILQVEFQGGNEFESTTIVPVGAVLDRIVIDRGAGLTTGTFPLQFLINGTSPLLLAEQGVQFDNDPSFSSVVLSFISTVLTVASGEEGTLKSTFLGTGTGSGYAYLLYWTALQT